MIQHLLERRKVMLKFKVDITETYKRTMELEAADEDAAYDQIEEQIMKGEIDLPRDGKDYNYNRELLVSEVKRKMPE